MITVNLDMEELADRVAEKLNKMLASEERLLTIDQAADRLAIGRTKMTEMIAAKQIPTVGKGRSLRIRQGALVEWMLRNEQRAQVA